MANIEDYSNVTYGPVVLTRKQPGIHLEDINSVWETNKTEPERTTFYGTFTKTNIEDSEVGQKFLNGLISNKDALCQGLGISEEQYDVFSCVAMAIASQETGMGKEEGYVEENTSGKTIRMLGKYFEVKFLGGGSASSGLTQLKINDFMNTLSRENVELLEQLGVTTKGLNQNNLFDEPDKAAIATIVVLNSNAKTYDEYQDILNEEHGKLENSLTQEEKNRSEALISSIMELYNSDLVSAEDKKILRESFADWMLSTEVYMDPNKKYKPDDTGFVNNEEYNFNNLTNAK